MSLRAPTGAPPPQGPGEDSLTHYQRVMVRFFQLVFATFENGSYRWVLDPNTTEIDISSQSKLARETVERRPAIIVSRGTVSMGNIAMDQFSAYDDSTGRRTHTDLVSMQVQVNCLSKELYEAQRIAHICAMATRRLKRSLMKAGIHRVGEELVISGATPPGSFVPGADNEIVMVSVSIPIWFQDWWTVEPIDKTLLRNLDVALTSGVNYPAPGATVISPPGMHGRPVQYSSTLSLTSRVRVNPTTGPKPRE